MACGDVPNSPSLPVCGRTALSVSKRSTPPDGSLIIPGDLITWVISVESRAAFPNGIVLEDFFVDCQYLTNLQVVTPGWSLTPTGPCSYTLDNPAAVNPGFHAITLTATAGVFVPDELGDYYEGFGSLVNTANGLVPEPAAGNSVTLTFGPMLVGDVGDQQLGAVVNYQYSIRSGTAPFTVSLFLGELPPGLSIDANGLLSGTTTQEGDYSFTLQLLDDNGNVFLLSDECLVTTVVTYTRGNEESVEALGLDLTSISMS